jgi:photosystem II stability/assembly factor-like uncharacterized protein
MKNSIFLIAVATSLICSYSGAFAQWQNQPCPIGQTPLWSISTVSRDVAWTIADYHGSIYRTTNGGQTWTKTPHEIPNNRLNVIEALDSITAFIGTYNTNDADSGSIYRTKDGGQSWQLVYNAPNKDNKYVDWVHFFDAQKGIAEFSQTTPNHHFLIVKTFDGGDTWTPIANQPTGNDISWENCAYFYDSLNGWFGTSSGRIFRTIDGGNNWTAYASGGGYALAIRFISPMIGIRTSNLPPCLARSTDGGETWTPVNNLPVSNFNEMAGATCVSTPSKNQLWVSGDAGSNKTPYILTSVDEGVTWQEQTFPELLEDNWVWQMSAVSFGALNDSVQAFGITNLSIDPYSTGGPILNYRQPIGLGGGPSKVRPDYATKNILLQNYPNPFNSQTTIEFVLPEQGKVTLTIYNELGQEVKKLLEAEMSPGSHQVVWNAKNYDSGVYFCNMTAKNFSQIRRMVLLR